MTFESLLRQENIILPQSVFDLCNKGLEKMKLAADKSHGHDHIDRMLKDLRELVKNRSSRKKINYHVLLPAIIWHDMWRSRRPVKTSWDMVIGLLIDGHGSKIVFQKAAKKLPTSLQVVIARHIRDHGITHIMQPLTLEQKILNDLDRLEEWHWPRLKRMVQEYFGESRPNGPMYWIAKFYLRFVLLRQTEKTYHLPWTRREFRRRREFFLKKIDVLLQ